MSLLAQYGPLGYYTNLDARQWNRAIREGGNEIAFIVTFKTNKVPAIQLIVSAATSATIQLIDINDQYVGSPLTLTIEDGASSYVNYKRLIYLGTTLFGYEDGYYSLKITNGTETYYSDIFCWRSDVLSEMLKISAVSSDVRIGRYYTLNMTGITYECYLDAIYLGIEPVVEDMLAQRNGSNIVLYGSTVYTRQFDIRGYEHIYKFLIGLRMLEANGTVSITWDYATYTANDIIVEKTDDHFTYAMQIKLSFMDNSETLSVINEIN